MKKKLNNQHYFLSGSDRFPGNGKLISRKTECEEAVRNTRYLVLQAVLQGGALITVDSTTISVPAVCVVVVVVCGLRQVGVVTFRQI